MEPEPIDNIGGSRFPRQAHARGKHVLRPRHLLHEALDHHSISANIPI